MIIKNKGIKINQPTVKLALLVEPKPGKLAILLSSIVTAKNSHPFHIKKNKNHHSSNI